MLLPPATRPLAVLLVAAALAACSSSAGGAASTPAPGTTAVSTTTSTTGASTTTGAATTTVASTTTAPTTTVAPTTTARPATVTPTTVAPTTTATVAHLRGTAYTFNTPDPIAGATVSVDELPGVTATTGADGSYDLAVPVGTTVTASITAAGHHSVSLQTFTLDAAHDGVEVDGANFQTPTDAIYDALRALVGGFVGKDPFDGGCVIVTTVSDPKVVGMSFTEFIAFHPHGLPGATASISPAAASAIYFNASVIPDTAQHVTSVDGGVLWTNVPPGTYTLTATAPGHTFATVPVVCTAGRVVNASPVWGLHATS